MDFPTSETGRWGVTPRPGDIHVYPINDLKPHTLTGTECACGPCVELEGATLVIVHNSYDGREIVEEAIRILKGEQ